MRHIFLFKKNKALLKREDSDIQKGALVSSYPVSFPLKINYEDSGFFQKNFSMWKCGHH